MTENHTEHPDHYIKEEYLNIQEAAEVLEIGEEELRKLLAQHKIPTHTIAGVFLRLRKNDIEHLKNKWRIERELFPKPEKYFSHHTVVHKATLLEKIADFWYFNDFYILCSILIAVLVYFILASQ